ncbi:MAG: hypothetical protein A2073_03965 [Deltaproteobacteria bacterium GWC2_42_11]|nr:MAG: hypothetical protein A2073_03965 [Deltaproteobacteria bacterium GWC2_42_11]HBO83737.1 hypothetical protein [Deltaproteobacteria bacterium]
MKSDKVLKGQVYFCPVCGAEVSVIRAGNGNLAPVCCNTEMILKAVLNPVYYCSVCRSEVMVICGNEDNLEPKCCNRIMKRYIT